VVADGVEPPPGVVVRPLAAVRGWGPPPPVLELAEWAAWRWAGPVASFLRTAAPPVAVRDLPEPPRRPMLGEGVRPVEAGGRTPSAVDALASDALQRDVAVVRLGPALDPGPILEAAAARLQVARPGDGVLVLAPERAQAAEVARRLRAGGFPVALLPEQWAAARAGGVVAVGTRAAAFAPVPRLAAAVVLDAHDQAYHEERAPTWHSWGVVVERARRDGAGCVLVSACPSVEMLAVGRLLTAARRVERRGWPAVEVVDRRGDDPRTGLFSPGVVRVARWASEAPGRRVVCVVNRTGRVRLLSCAACDELARCEHCGGALELAEDDSGNRGAGRDSGGGVGWARGAAWLHCRRCGAARPVVCAACGAARLKARRLGVTRVREELEVLAGAPVAALWGRPARGPGRGEEHTASDAAVVVGTEAALHRVPCADVVAFLDFDAELLAPRFRAGEQALALLARAARIVAGGGAGRPGGTEGERAPGRVLVQTRLPQHDTLRSAVSADPAILAHAESEVRHALGLPPFSAQAQLSGAGADAYGAALRAAASPRDSVSGPVDAAWSVRAADHQTLCDLLASVPRPPGRLRVEVDPVRA
jgi:primosomal protein N' (replication factor Y)